jgi:hypothetical protein
MRLTFHTDGGFAVFPGLQQPFGVNTAELATEDAAQIERLVANATASRHSRSPATGGADQIAYTIEIIDDHNRHHTLHAVDPVDDPALRALIDRLSELRATQ